MARKVDMSLLAQLHEQSQGQELKKGNSKTTDARFPVFRTPVNEDILVYIPKTNLIVTENGEDMPLLETYNHNYKKGNSFGQLRCINGLQGGIFETLGFDGTCPACEAMKDSWSLYNRKIEAEAKKLGIDPQNDAGDVLKSARQRILSEMDMKNAEDYVTFPVVIIPIKGKMQPTDDALATDANGNFINIKVEYVTWRRKRYEDNILASLDTLMVNPGHPAGMFWVWKFSYNTEGKQANARDSAKNAKYVPIVDGNALNFLERFTLPCEKVAKEFTNVKATEVILANQFMYKEDLQTEVDSIMAKTRAMLELSEVSSVTAPQLNSNPLASFGGASVAPTLDLGVLGGGESPIKFGE